MTTLDITLVAVVAILFFTFMVHHEIMFGRMIKQNEKVMRTSSERLEKLIEQNNTLLIHADHRLDKANEMVLTLAHSADLLAESITEIKDMAVERARLYERESKDLMQNRDDFKEAYNHLLVKFEEQRQRIWYLADDDHRALKELASRPMVNNSFADNQK